MVSVEQLGASVLGEVEEDKLMQILFELRQQIIPENRDILGCPPLDRFLEIFRYTPLKPLQPNRNDLTLYGDHNFGDYNRIPTQHDLQPLHGTNPKKNVDLPIIHISSARSAAGKTNLLYYLTALSILPNKYMGKEQAVLWLDTSNSFLVLRLAQVCKSHLLRKGANIDSSSIDEIVHAALQQVHVFAIQSSKQLVETLRAVPSYLFHGSSHDSDLKHPSTCRPLSLLIIDSATSFSWQNRFELEIARLESLNTGMPVTAEFTNPEISSSTAVASQIMTQVRALSQMFDCSIIYTTNSSHSNTTIQQSHRVEEPAVDIWTSNATLNLTLCRIEVSQFAPQASMEICLKDKQKRHDIVSRERFRVSVADSAIHLAAHTVMEKLESSGGKDGFVLRITDGGVLVEDEVMTDQASHNEGNVCGQEFVG